MSFAYTTRVWKSTTLKRGKRLVMLALAYHADDSGQCWPGMPLLVEETQLTDRQVRRVLNDLVTDGLIAIEERAIGRGKKPHYKLFPNEIKADIMSESMQKADICDTEKRTLCPTSETKADISGNKSGHFAQGKADISDTKADILNTDYSHTRIESPIEPTEELPKESSSSSEDDDEPGRDAIHQTWFDTYRAEMPKDIEALIARELGKCPEEAILHAIRASVNAKERTFKYLKSCALNYIPPAPEQPTSTRYAVDLPGVYRMPAPTAPPEPAKLPPSRPLATEALPLDGIWFQMRQELFASLPANSDARAWLRDSRLEETGTAPDNAGKVVPLYTVWVTDPKALDWCNNRAASTLRRTLRSMLGHPVMVVAALEAEPEAVSV